MDPAALAPADLLAIAGASVAAVTVTQFAKMLFTLTRRVVRIVSVLTGLVVVVGRLHEPSTIDGVGVVLSAVVGMQAGMAANAAFDTVRDRINYQTVAADATGGTDGVGEVSRPCRLGHEVRISVVP